MFLSGEFLRLALAPKAITPQKAVTMPSVEPTWRVRGLSKSVISRVIIGATPFRVLIPPLITYLLSLLGL